MFFPLATKGPRGIRFTGREKRGKCSYCVAPRIEIVFFREERDQRKIEREDGMLETSRIGMAFVKCEKSMSGILNRGKLVNISGELMNIETQ